MLGRTAVAGDYDAAADSSSSPKRKPAQHFPFSETRSRRCAVGDPWNALGLGVVQHQFRDPRPVLLGAAQQRGIGGGPLEVQVRLVLPGEPDTAVHLDRVGRDPG